MTSDVKIWHQKEKGADIKMIYDLPDLPVPGKRPRPQAAQQFFPKRRRRAAVSRPQIPQVVRDSVRDVAVSVATAEIRDSLKEVAFIGLQKSFTDPQKQQKLKNELDKSRALPVLLHQHLAAIDSAPDWLKLVLLIGQKVSGVYFGQ